MKWGSVDVKQFEELQKRIEQLQKVDMDAFCKKIAKELAARLLRMVKQRTPVDSGFLRNNWRSDERVSYNDGEYKITIYNATEYAVYVEYGHRTRNHKGWVEGRFMMTKSEILLGNQVEKIIETRLKQFLREQLNG